jgi:hypothetical protein
MRPQRVSGFSLLSFDSRRLHDSNNHADYWMRYPHFPTEEQGTPLQQSAWVVHIWP